jgi:hypothetical protein
MRYSRTNKKRSTFTAGIAREEAIERCIGTMEAELDAMKGNLSAIPSTSELATENDDRLLDDTLGSRYAVGVYSREATRILPWLEQHMGDSACEVRWPIDFIELC